MIELSYIESVGKAILTFIPLVALLFAVFVFLYKKRLYHLQIVKTKMEIESAKQANLNIEFIEKGRNKKKLKIWNAGPATARNIRIEVPDDSDILAEWEIKEKFPCEKMNKHDSIELNALFYIGSQPLKHKIILTWDDDSRENHREEFYPSI